MERQVYTIPAAAQFLGVSYELMLGLVRTGEIPSFSHGPRGWRRVTRAALMAWLDSKSEPSVYELPALEVSKPIDFRAVARDVFNSLHIESVQG